MMQKQSITDHNPEEGRYGDCLRACVASVLGMSINDVPHFCHGKSADDTTWFKDLNDWLRPRGLAFVEFKGQGWDDVFAVVDCFHIISGPSPRYENTLHSTVGRSGEIVFDPHPSNAGLAEGERTFGFFIKTGFSFLECDPK